MRDARCISVTVIARSFHFLHARNLATKIRIHFSPWTYTRKITIKILGESLSYESVNIRSRYVIINYRTYNYNRRVSETILAWLMMLNVAFFSSTRNYLFPRNYNSACGGSRSRKIFCRLFTILQESLKLRSQRWWFFLTRINKRIQLASNVPKRITRMCNFQLQHFLIPRYSLERSAGGLRLRWPSFWKIFLSRVLTRWSRAIVNRKKWNYYDVNIMLLEISVYLVFLEGIPEKYVLAWEGAFKNFFEIFYKLSS